MLAWSIFLIHLFLRRGSIIGNAVVLKTTGSNPLQVRVLSPPPLDIEYHLFFAFGPRARQCSPFVTVTAPVPPWLERCAVRSIETINSRILFSFSWKNLKTDVPVLVDE